MRKKRVVAHVFLCMLTYYVEYHMCRKLAPMLFAYDDPEEKQAQQNDAVEPAKLKAKKKVPYQKERRRQNGHELCKSNDRIGWTVPTGATPENRDRCWTKSYHAKNSCIRPRIHITADSQALYTQYLQRIAQQKNRIIVQIQTVSPTQKWAFKLLGIKPLDSFNSKN